MEPITLIRYHAPQRVDYVSHDEDVLTIDTEEGRLNVPQEQKALLYGVGLLSYFTDDASGAMPFWAEVEVGGHRHIGPSIRSDVLMTLWNALFLPKE